MILSIPVILASMTLSLIKVFEEDFVEVNFYQPLFASIVAFVTALLSILFLMRFIRQFDFNIFVIYRVLLGVFILLFGLI